MNIAAIRALEFDVCTWRKQTPSPSRENGNGNFLFEIGSGIIVIAAQHIVIFFVCLFSRISIFLANDSRTRMWHTTQSHLGKRWIFPSHQKDKKRTPRPNALFKTNGEISEDEMAENSFYQFHSPMTTEYMMNSYWTIQLNRKQQTRIIMHWQKKTTRKKNEKVPTVARKSDDSAHIRFSEANFLLFIVKYLHAVWSHLHTK